MTTNQAQDCVFCAIIRGAVSSHAVYEDDLTLAFLDINPATDGHTLVVPKEHAADLFDISADHAAAVMRAAKRVAAQIDERLSPDGLTLVQTNRPAGWQDVFHLHLHLIPRWDDDRLTRPWSPQPAPADHLADIAVRLRGTGPRLSGG